MTLETFVVFGILLGLLLHMIGGLIVWWGINREPQR